MTLDNNNDKRVSSSRWKKCSVTGNHVEFVLRPTDIAVRWADLVLTSVYVPHAWAGLTDILDLGPWTLDIT